MNDDLPVYISLFTAIFMISSGIVLVPELGKYKLSVEFIILLLSVGFLLVSGGFFAYDYDKKLKRGINK